MGEAKRRHRDDEPTVIKGPFSYEVCLFGLDQIMAGGLIELLSDGPPSPRGVTIIKATANLAARMAGEAFIEFCVANNVAVLKDPNYDPFAGRSEAERIEWLIFSLFLSYDGEARRPGYKPDDAWQHVEYLLQRPFQNVDEWLGSEGTKWRRRCGMGQPAQHFHAAWAAFRDAHRDLTLEDINAKGHALKTRFEKDRAERIITAAPPRRGRGSGQA